MLTSAQTRGARLKAAAATARASWLLFLAPGTVPDATWIEETRRFIEQADLRGCATTRAAAFRPGSATFRPALLEAFALLWAALSARPDTSQGLLIARSLYDALGGHRDVPEPERDLARRLGRRRVMLLRSGAMAAPHADS